jgi:hypothetical protein
MNITRRQRVDLHPAERLLERMGWAVERADIGLTQHRIVIVLQRRDGLVVSFDARGQDASLSRDMVIYHEAGRGTWEHVFLGRSTWRGANSDAIRGHLRRLAHYIADNAMTPHPRLEGRAVIRALIATQEDMT